jgi:hypothetical protein
MKINKVRKWNHIKVVTIKKKWGDIKPGDMVEVRKLDNKEVEAIEKYVKS